MRALFLIGCLAWSVGCASPDTERKPAASAILLDEHGERVGTAELNPAKGGVRIFIEFFNLPPGDHALHIHNVGECHVGEGGDKAFASAGPHFNPFDKQHGRANPAGPHAGDLPNFTIGAKGTALVDVVAELVTLDEGADNSLFQPGGTCLVVHAKPDDNVTDPSGNAGQRLACGLIVKPQE
jgi:Cu-Zn family superoxide dismutase